MRPKLTGLARVLRRSLIKQADILPHKTIFYFGKIRQSISGCYLSLFTACGVLFSTRFIDQEKMSGFYVTTCLIGVSFLGNMVLRHRIATKTIYRIAVGANDELLFWTHGFRHFMFKPQMMKVDPASIEVADMTLPEDIDPRHEGGFIAQLNFKTLEGTEQRYFTIMLNPSMAEVFDTPELCRVFKA